MTSFAAPMNFKPIILDPSLSIIENPAKPWLAVVCRWKDAHTFRQKHPDICEGAAVVGPLRTPRGIDMLFRNLLANPQIRVVVVAGVDLVEGEPTTWALWKAFGRTPDGGVCVANGDCLGTDLHEHIWSILGCVTLLTQARALDLGSPDPNPISPDTLAKLHPDVVADYHEAKKQRDPIILMPPQAEATVPAPVGDPGQRIVADLLREVYPRALHEIMKFGRIVPTQYGDTRELLNLVTVIRDPAASAPALPDWISGHAQVESYARRLFGGEVPEGVPYSYSSRLDAGGLGGIGGIGHMLPASGSSGAFCSRIGTVVTLENGVCPECGWNLEGILAKRRQEGIVNQLRQLDTLLASAPLTRAAYVTPWHIALDAGKESGRPCLVSALFRAIPGLTGCGNLNCNGCAKCTNEHGSIIPFGSKYELNLTVMFRSHDMFAAYALNLASVCMWLCEMAEKHDMTVGTLTCISSSAHICERDWADAEKLVEERRFWKTRDIELDERSCWSVTVTAGDECDVCDGRGEIADICPPSHDGFDIPCRRCDGGRVNRLLRATATNRDGSEVIAVFEAKTPEALRRKVLDSGLITSISNALWLGDEIRRVR